MGFGFGNILGLLGLLSLIPLIILYLIKPRPSTLKVPSLMFFFSRSRTTTFESFLRHFHEDILFYLQLAVLALLAFSISQPLLSFSKNAVSNNLVFVLDVSASSQVLENGKTRLDIAKDNILDLATSKNSLILIKSRPVIALQNAGRSELARYLDSVEATDDLGDIASAIVLGVEMLDENKGRVVVLSDLITSKGIPIDIAESIANAKGIHVDLINTASSKRNNIGIIDMALSKDTANIYIKNYNSKDENVKLIIGNDVKDLMVKAGNVEPFVFQLSGGDTEIKLDVKDDFSADNKVIITNPHGNKIKVLLLSKTPSKFLKAALNSMSDVELTTAQLPVIPKDDFDVVIINNVDNKDLLDGSFEDLKKRADAGEINIIIAAWDGIDTADFKGLLPLRFGPRANGGAVNVDQVTRFTRDVDFGEIKSYYKNYIENGINLASFNGSSVLASFENSNGKIIYYGIMDDSDFKLNPSYPVFWNNLVSYLAGRSDLNEINLKTGSILEISNTTSFNLDKTGIFNIGDSKIAVNLLDEKESNINLDKKLIDSEVLSGIKVKLNPVKVNVDYNLDFYLILTAFFIVGFELWYIKIRGEI